VCYEKFIEIHISLLKSYIHARARAHTHTQSIYFYVHLYLILLLSFIGKKDNLSSPSSRLMLGQPCKSGTGAFSVLSLYDYKKQ